VTGLEVVLPDGDVVQLGGGKSVDAPGYDLLGAFVGSEGTLGVATRITLRVVPAPPAWRTLVAFYAHMEEAGRTVSEIVAAGLIPGAMEIMDRLSIEAAEAATGAGYPTDAGAALVVELDGPDDECSTGFDEIVAICERNEATGIRIAQDEDERALIWKARKAAFAAMGRLAPNYYVQDSVIPRTRLPEVLKRIDELAAAHDLRVANVFHAGDGNLHPLVLYDAAVPGEAERAEECAGEIVKACVDLGGSITGEHGVGVDKKRYMPSMFGEPDLAAFQMLRCAFDPAGLANPGKLMPTPRLCGEVPGPYRQHPLEAAGLADRF
jgi:glycolate oxidase